VFQRPVINPVPTTDARKEPRVQVSWFGELSGEDGRQLPVKVIDLSRSGMGVAGDDKLRRQQLVELRVVVPRLPDLDEQVVMRLRARVVYQMHSGGAWRTGLQFVDPTPEHRAILEPWLLKESIAW